MASGVNAVRGSGARKRVKGPYPVATPLKETYVRGQTIRYIDEDKFSNMHFEKILNYITPNKGSCLFCYC